MIKGQIIFYLGWILVLEQLDYKGKLKSNQNKISTIFLKLIDWSALKITKSCAENVNNENILGKYYQIRLACDKQRKNGSR